MRLPSQLIGTLAMCLAGLLLQACSHAPRTQTAPVYPLDLPDRAQLSSLIDAFVDAHRTCSFPESSAFPPAVQAPCLGPTTIWAVRADPARLGYVSISLRQLTAPHNEFVLEAHHGVSGWVILSIALIDA